MDGVASARTPRDFLIADIRRHLHTVIDKIYSENETSEERKTTLTRRAVNEILETLLDTDSHGNRAISLPIQTIRDAVHLASNCDEIAELKRSVSRSCKEATTTRDTGPGKKQKKSFSLFDMLDRKPLGERVTAMDVIEHYEEKNTEGGDNSAVLLKVASMLEKVDDVEDICYPPEWDKLKAILHVGLQSTGSSVANKIANVHLKLFRLCTISEEYIPLQLDLCWNLLQSVVTIYENAYICLPEDAPFSLKNQPNDAISLLPNLVEKLHTTMCAMGPLLRNLPEEDTDKLFFTTLRLLRNIAPSECDPEMSAGGETSILLLPSHLFAVMDPYANWFSTWARQVSPLKFFHYLAQTNFVEDVLWRCYLKGPFRLLRTERIKDYSSCGPAKHHVAVDECGDWNVENLEHVLFLQSVSILRTVLAVTQTNFPFTRNMSALCCDVPYVQSRDILNNETTPNPQPSCRPSNDINQTDKDVSCGNDPHLEMSLEDLLTTVEPFIAVMETGLGVHAASVDIALANICGEALSVLVVHSNDDYTPGKTNFMDLFSNIADRLVRAFESNNSTGKAQPALIVTVQLFIKMLDANFMKGPKKDLQYLAFGSSLERISEAIFHFMTAAKDKCIESDAVSPHYGDRLYFDFLSQMISLLHQTLPYSDGEKSLSCITSFLVVAVRYGFKEEHCLVLAQLASSMEGIKVLEELGIIEDCANSLLPTVMMEELDMELHARNNQTWNILAQICTNKRGFFSIFTFKTMEMIKSQLKAICDGGYYLQSGSHLYLLLYVVVLSPWFGEALRNDNHLRIAMNDISGILLEVHDNNHTAENKLWDVMEVGLCNLDFVTFLTRNPKFYERAQQASVRTTKAKEDTQSSSSYTRVMAHLHTFSSGQDDGSKTDSLLPDNIQNATTTVLATIRSCASLLLNPESLNANTFLSNFRMKPDAIQNIELFRNHNQKIIDTPLTRDVFCAPQEYPTADSQNERITLCFLQGFLSRHGFPFLHSSLEELSALFVLRSSNGSISIDWFAVCLYALSANAKDAKQCLGILQHKPGASFIWPRLDTEGYSPMAITHLVKHILGKECPHILAALEESYPPCCLDGWIALWWRQSFVGNLLFCEVLTLQGLVLCMGVDYMVYFIVAIVRELQAGIMDCCVGADTIGGQLGNRVFAKLKDIRVMETMAFVQDLQSRHGNHCLDVLSNFSGRCHKME